jgi:hypothetical protein
MKTKAILEFIFGEEIFGRHDPKKEAWNHSKWIKYPCPYTHEEWEEEQIKRRETSYKYVIDKIKQCKIIWEEQQRKN